MEAIDKYADEMVGRADEAAKAFRLFTQEQVDAIVEAVYRAAWKARVDLARLAIEETAMGNLEDKVLKNAYATLLVYEDIRARKTVGVVSHDPPRGSARSPSRAAPSSRPSRSPTRRPRRSSRR